MENKEFEVNVDNVQECWKLYEIYIEKEKQTHYSDATYEEFVSWCEDNLIECPNCEAIVLKDEQEWYNHPLNSENVCDECMEDGYGK